jgi:hypothetical protein
MHAWGAGLRKVAALAVSLVSVACWLVDAGLGGADGWQESGRAGWLGGRHATIVGGLGKPKGLRYFERSLLTIMTKNEHKHEIYCNLQ